MSGAQGWGDGRLLAVAADQPPGRLFAAEVSAALGLQGVRFMAPGNPLPDEADALFAVLADEPGASGPALAQLATVPVPVVVCVSPALIDAAFAALPPQVVLLCDPGLAEAVAEVALALAPRRAGVAEQDHADTLRRLGEETARIARALAALAGGGGAPAPTVRASPAEVAPADAADRFRRLLRERRLRDGFFAPELFADPAWDMLLDLSAARAEGRTVSVSSLCIAAAVPPTTALRWIRALTDAGLFERVPDPDDRRRSFIGMTDKAAEAMAAYLTALERLR